MAYDEFLADRIRLIFKRKGIHFQEKKMMGGLCFMVDNKMCCGISFSKKRNLETLMIRIGEEIYKKNTSRKGFAPMDFTGRPMKGFAFITPEGYDLDKDLEYWIQLCVDYNPLATRSKKKLPK